MNANIEENLSAKKLKLLSMMINIGDEAFKRDKLESIFSHILNNTVTVYPYNRACIIDARNILKVVAVSGQETTNNNSEYCIHIKNAIAPFKNIKEITKITLESLDKVGANTKARESFKKIMEQTKALVLVPFKKNDEQKEPGFIWVMEFFNDIDDKTLSILPVLSNRYSTAIWYHIKSNNSFVSESVGVFWKKVTLSKVMIGIVVLIILLFTIKVNQTATSNFELIPSNSIVAFAPFSGIISHVYFKNGAAIKKGDEILSYDITDYQIKLSEAKNEYDILETQLRNTESKSFEDSKELGNLKLLKLQLEKQQLLIEYYQWYMDHSRIIADRPGILLMDKSNDWFGKSVKEGEKIFEIVSPEKLTAEVQVKEADSYVLEDPKNVKLYFYSSPEESVNGKFLSITPKPVNTETGSYVYIAKYSLEDNSTEDYIGMRGIAKIAGPKVSIAYYLFKNTLMWWRMV